MSKIFQITKFINKENRTNDKGAHRHERSKLFQLKVNTFDIINLISIWSTFTIIFTVQGHSIFVECFFGCRTRCTPSTILKSENFEA